MKDVIAAARDVIAQGCSCTLVTIADVRGSAPREVGASLCVSADHVVGTIGGGNLEYLAITEARKLIKDNSQRKLPIETHEYALGPHLGQCCGGKITLCFETFSPHQTRWLSTALDHIEKNEKCAYMDKQGRHISI